VNSLKEMTDIDIRNFVELIKNVNIHNPPTSVLKTIYDIEIRTKDFYGEFNWGKSISVDKVSLDYTVEKLKRTNTLSCGEGGLGSVGNAKGAFMVSPVTLQLYDLIKRTKLEE
jgi:hypothetical protein